MNGALKQYLDYFGRSAIEINHDRRPRPKLFATTTVPVTLHKWYGHGSDPEWVDVELPVGTTVKVVMYSRFGDVGITDQLDAEHGYSARVDPESGVLDNWREEP